MQNLYKKAEFFSNIAIIIVAFLLSSIFVGRYLSSDTTKSSISESIKVGTKLPLPNVDWNKTDKTLLLAISTSCRYCTDSLPFYKKLVQQKNERNNFKLIVITPQNINEAQHYLSENGIEVDEVRQAVLSEINVRATPTLIVLDNVGAVVNSWVGKLPPTKENEVTQSLFGERPLP